MSNKDLTVQSLFKTEKLSKRMQDEDESIKEYEYITDKILEDKLHLLDVNLSDQEAELLVLSLGNHIIPRSILLSDLSDRLALLGIKENPDVQSEGNEKEVEYEQSFYQESVKGDNEVPISNLPGAVDKSNGSGDIYEGLHDKSNEISNQNIKNKNPRGEEILQSESDRLSERIEHDSEYEEFQQDIDPAQPVGQDKSEEHNESQHHSQDKSIDNDQYEMPVEEHSVKADEEYDDSHHEKEPSEDKQYEEEVIDDLEPEKAQIESNQFDEEQVESEQQEKSVRYIDDEPAREEENNELFQQQDNESQIGKLESNDSRVQSKGKPLDFTNILPLGVKILYNLTNYITENPESNIFEEYVFVQAIQTKKRQNSVYLINAKDFFETLEIFGICTNPIKPSQKSKMDQARESIKDTL